MAVSARMGAGAMAMLLLSLGVGVLALAWLCRVPNLFVAECILKGAR